MKKLLGDQDHINENLYAYIKVFVQTPRYIFGCKERPKACKVLLETAFAP